MIPSRERNVYIIYISGSGIALSESKMLGEQHLPFVLYAIFTAVLLSEGSQGILKLFCLLFNAMF